MRAFSKRGGPLLVVALLVLVMTITFPVGTRAANSVSAIVVKASSANLQDGALVLDTPLTNNQPDTLLIVSQVWNYLTPTGVYNDHALGVRFNANGKWEIFNIDGTPIPDGSAFSVGMLETDGTSENFQRMGQAGPNTIGPNYFLFDHSFLNEQPTALANLTLMEFAPIRNRRPQMSEYGLWYDSVKKRWAGIFENTSDAPDAGWGFNVFPFTPMDGFLHTSNAQNISANFTYLDDARINDNPQAILFVTHNANPQGSVQTYHSHHIGVWYDTTNGRWAIFNQDQAPMVPKISFNVRIGQHSDIIPTLSATQGMPATLAPLPTVPPVPTLRPTAVLPPPGTPCLSTRLAVGSTARVTTGAPNRLRSEPSTDADIIGLLPAGSLLNVLGSQVCLSGILWVRVTTGGQTGWTAEAFGNTYLLEPATAATPAVTAAPTSALPFGIVGVTAFTPTPTLNACPANLNFYGQIVVNRSGIVTYRIERSDGFVGPVETWNAVEGALTKDWIHNWPNVNAGSYWVRLHVLTPNDISSNQATIVVSCGGASIVTMVTVTTSPLSSSTCPTQEFISSGQINVNGPTTVQYRWRRSDGASSAVQSISFAAAGAQVVQTSWMLGAGGTFWHQLEIIAPNAMLSNQSTFTHNACP